MKRSLWLSLFVSFGIAVSARAESTGVVGVTATRTSFNSTWDEVDLHIISLTGPTVGRCGVVGYLTGTWTATGGAFNLPGNGSTWYNNISNNFDAQDRLAPQTMLNFSTKTPDTATRAGFSPYASFYVGYYITPADGSGRPGFAPGPVDWTPGPGPDPNPWIDNSDPADPVLTDHQGYGFDNTLLGKFYVTKSTQWTPGQTIFSGDGLFLQADGSMGNYPLPITVQIVPEPSTLALLCCGLLALFAHARHKRR